MNDHWQFWIDVGGTFTDCIAIGPNGDLRRSKVLSSGVIKSVVAGGSGTSEIRDPKRTERNGFWRGYGWRLVDRDGRVVHTAQVADSLSAAGNLILDRPLNAPPAAGQAYELVSSEEAPILAIRYLLELAIDDPLPGVSIRLGTTRGTNALLTRQGARTALATTRGLGDILHIGYQNRPKLFELAIQKHEPLFEVAIEIDERIANDGTVLESPRVERVRQQLETLRNAGIQSLAICLLNAYEHFAHEQLIARIAREVGFEEISCSHQIAPLIKLVSRGDTTVVDAYLNPVLRTYIHRLHACFGDDASSDLRLLTSAGGLVSPTLFSGKDSILSGPAGGVVGFSKTAEAAGFSRAIGFDMGGTSTDVTRYDGRYELQYESEKAGVRIVTPMMSIETVAAGGGSICGFDGVRLAVGPASAGAQPGPACYGRGGPLAVTDMNFVLGRLLPQHFPFPLERRPVAERLSVLAEQVRQNTGAGYSIHALAEGFLKVANANMAKAIRAISVAQGYDPRDYVLVAFGGAAPQHACAIADQLEISRVLIHPDAGILSAYGMGLADVVRHRAAGIYRTFDTAAAAELRPLFDQMERTTRDEVLAEGVPSGRINVLRSLDLRYAGTDACLTIAESADGTAAARFHDEHERRFGYAHRTRAIEAVAARVEVTGRSAQTCSPSQRVPAREASPDEYVEAWFGRGFVNTAVFDRARLQPGHRIAGPALIVEDVSTLIVEREWQADVLSGGELLLERLTPAARDVADGAEADPVTLEIFNNQFASIAEQMGIVLRQTSSSVNVKERLDYSCALFTNQGALVVNAPHIPVHLGAMSETVRQIITDNSSMVAGDVFVTNDPYRGGSHLPDITVVTPVFVAGCEGPAFFTASRAHHAEIGGVTPGSMPPFSKNLAEEGVLIRNFKLSSGGRSHRDRLEQLLRRPPYPSRSVRDNLADLDAQVAANQQGARQIAQLVERSTYEVVSRYMGLIQHAAEKKMRDALAKLPDGRHTFRDCLDDGSPIQVTIDCAGDTATIDFTGTGGVLAGNLNANRAIVMAAVIYSFRCLIDDDIPLNEGVLAPLTVRLPPCLLNPPEAASPDQCAAVAGGNVETSQRIVDVLLGALGVAAASQGTMNNVLFGDDGFGYYETICGGAGATADHDGADAVHTHMTNTRLTDPEILEQRFPVRVLEFSIRRGSGGRGRRRGGDGVVRKLEFLAALRLSILSQRRGEFVPYGVNGGAPGLGGQNLLHRRDGRVEVLEGLAATEVAPGDVLEIKTPGGGGWG